MSLATSLHELQSIISAQVSLCMVAGYHLTSVTFPLSIHAMMSLLTAKISRRINKESLIIIKAWAAHCTQWA